MVFIWNIKKKRIRWEFICYILGLFLSIKGNLLLVKDGLWVYLEFCIFKKTFFKILFLKKILNFYFYLFLFFFYYLLYFF